MVSIEMAQAEFWVLITALPIIMHLVGFLITLRGSSFDHHAIVPEQAQIELISIVFLFSPIWCIFLAIFLVAKRIQTFRPHPEYPWISFKNLQNIFEGFALIFMDTLDVV